MAVTNNAPLSPVVDVTKTIVWFSGESGNQSVPATQWIAASILSDGTAQQSTINQYTGVSSSITSNVQVTQVITSLTLLPASIQAKFTGIYAYASYGWIQYGRPLFLGASVLRTGDTHDGFVKKHNTIPVYIKGDKKQPLGNLIHIYDKIKETEKVDVEEILEIIEPFIDEQQEYKYLPDFDKINLQALALQEEQSQRFAVELERLMLKLEQIKQANEDDELLLMAIFACV